MPVTLSSGADWRPPQLSLTSPTTTYSRIDGYVPFILKHTWNGLAIFAVFVIVRHTAQSILVRRRRKRDTISSLPDTPRSGTGAETHQSLNRAVTPQQASQCRHHGAHQQHKPLYYLFPPPAPPPSWLKMDDNKSGDSYGSAPDGSEPKTAQSDSNPPIHAGGQEDRGNTVSSSTFGRQDTTLQRYIMIRPPPAPPLTPPAAAPRPFFNLGEHKTSGLAAAADLDSNFIHQPNPDYHGSTSTAETSPEAFGSPSETQERSFSRSLPISISPSLQHHNSNPSRRGTSGDEATVSSNAGFSPSSYPPISPFLPPAPFNIDGLPPSMGVEVHGEVLSATDGFGAPWTRHTRVYGGGVCLACAASGGEGGFYGATAIRPDGH